MTKRLLTLVLVVLLAAPALSACAPEELALYTDLPKADVEKLIAPFVQSSGVKVKLFTFSGADSLISAVAPQRGGVGVQPTPTANPNPPDIILTSDMAVMAELTQRQALASYMPPGASALPYGANGGGYWYGFGGRGWVLAWNTELVQEAPEGFEDLASDKYPMNSVAVPNPEQYYFYPLSVYTLMGADYAMNMFQTLLLNGADFNASPSSALGKVVSGEMRLCLTTYELARKQKDEGRSIDFIFPDQWQGGMGTYVEFYCVALASGGRSEKNARKLDDWLLSAEAEKLSAELGLSDVTLRDVGGDAPVVKPLAVSLEQVLRSAQAAGQALRSMYERNR